MHTSRRQFFLSAMGFATGSGVRVDGDTDPRRLKPFQGPRTDVSYARMHRESRCCCREVSLAKLNNGKVVATFQQCVEGRHTGDILLIRSTDKGITWDRQSITVFGDGEALDVGYCLATVTQLSNGTLLSCSAKFQFLFEGGLGWKKGAEIEGLYLRKSSDNGCSWSPQSKLDIAPFQVAWIRGSILELPDGTLLLPLCGQREDRYKRTTEAISSFLSRSKDGGTSWSLHGIIASDPGARDYEDPCIVCLPDGRLLAMVKSHCAPRHNPLGGYFYQTVSEDEGVTWSSPSQTRIWGDPADLMNLQDGRLLCTFGYRIHPNPGIRGCVSENGISWRPENIFVVKSVPDLALEEMDFGCPRSIQLDDGFILTAYHVARENNHKDHSYPKSRLRQHLESARYRL